MMQNPGLVYFFELCDSSPYLYAAICTVFKKVCFQSVDYFLLPKGLDVVKGFPSSNILSPHIKICPSSAVIILLKTS